MLFYNNFLKAHYVTFYRDCEQTETELLIEGKGLQIKT